MQRNAQDILHSYLLATRFDSSSYKAWHTWALANFELVSYLDSHQDGRVDDTPSDSIAGHVVQAISGLLATS
jgi:FKBP12-rapamycin complex-associated protein